MATFTLEKDLLIECPFDANHKIAIRNQIKHIIECEKRSDSKFSVCIYNASHRMARHEFAQHIRSCPDSRQHHRERYERQQSASTAANTKVDAKLNSIEPKIASNCQTFTEEAEEEDNNNNEDNWEDDNCPTFSIMNQLRPSDHLSTNLVQNKSLKMTKNQKKRNRRKAAIGAKQETQINSIWD